MDKQQDKVSFIKGPWDVRLKVNGHCGFSIEPVNDCVMVATVYCDEISSDCPNDLEHERPVNAKSFANAHLIAASPCMYEVCKVAASSRDWTELREPDYDHMSENVLEYIEAIEARVYRLEALAKAALSKANPNSNLTPSELRDKLDAVEVIGVVS